MGRSQRRKRRLVIAGVLAACAAIALLMAVPSLAAARRSMESGQDHLERGRQMLLAGRAKDAAGSFAAASNDFREALDSAGNPVLRVTGFLPLVGRTPDAIHDLAQIGSRLARAGEQITKGIDLLPQGLASLAPSGGRIPIKNISDLAPFVASAQGSLEQAQAIALRLPDSWLPGPVSDAVTSLREKLDKALPLARSAGSLLVTLPEFAGANGARSYLVAGMNPAELRGTGGFMGVWSLLTIENGSISLAPFQDIRTLKNASPSRVPAPTEEMAYLYGRDVASYWRAVNSMPDAATAATLSETLWDAEHRTRLDGVIYVAPQALSLMLDASGPVRSASLKTTLTSSSVVSFVTNKAYFRFGDSFTNAARRKEALGIAAGNVWNHFLEAAPPKQALDALAGAASSGYIVLHSADPKVQAAFEAAGIAGLWRDEGDDFFGTSINNGAGTKIDYYMRRQLVYGVALGPSGSARANARVVLSNEAPANAPAGYVFGPYPPGVGGVPLKAGDSYSILQTYCAAECQLEDTTPNPTVNGKPLPVGQATENGLTLFVSDQKIGPQETQTLDYSLVLQNVWQGDESGGTYRLRLEGQPTIKPTTASVSITVPDGMKVISASEGTTIADGRATWAGEVGKGVDIEVAFQPPLLSRTWAHIKGFLNKPVIKF